MAVRITCPDVQTLQDFLLGQLAPDDIGRVQEHLACCPECLAAIGDLPTDDPLVQAVEAQRKIVGPEEEAIERLVERLRHRSPDSNLELTPGPNRGTDTPAEAEADSYAFLAPPRQAGELGWLGPYRVLRVLGRGGMGIVFEAEDPQLQRHVALKVMKPGLAAHLDAGKRFLREAQATAAIQHDHIVTIHQVGEDRGIPYIAMQLLRGETLEQRLQKRGRRPVAEAVRLGRQIAKGLAAAHARGLIHRDIKPNNIWIEETGDAAEDLCRERVKLLDFGLAGAATDLAPSAQSGIIAGTPAYMAPEQAADAPVDHRCDLFGLGCVLYRVCTGELPFKGVKPLTIFWSLAVTEPPPPRELNAVVPRALSDLIEKLLAKDPADRPQSAREVGDALRAIEADLAGPAQPAPPPRRRTGTLAAVALTLLATLGSMYAPGVYRLVTAQGQIVVETDDPDVKVVVKQGEQQITIIDPKVDRDVTLKAGDYQVEMLPEKFGLGLTAQAFALTRGGRQIVRVRWEPPSPLQTLVGPEAVFAAQFCLDGSHVITSGGNRRENGKWVLGSDFALRLWDLKTGREVRQFKDHIQIVRALTVTGDGKRAISAGGENEKADRDWTLRLWDLETGQLIRRFEDRHDDVVSSVACSANGKRVVSASRDKSLRLWDADTGREIRCLDQGRSVYWHVDISRDGKQILTTSNDGRLRLWDADTENVERSLNICRDWSPVRLSPDARFALVPSRTADNRGDIELWDLEKEVFIRTFAHESGWTSASAFSADGKRFVTYGSDGTVRLWDLNGKELCRFPPLDVPETSLKIVSAAAFSPDGRFAVAATWGGTVRIWKLPE